MTEEKTRVGVGVMIFKNNKILLGKRKSVLGKGEYASPGGHLEYMESFEACARRETMEEAGIEIQNVRFLVLINLKKYAPRHYVHIGMVADWKSGEPKVLEPEKLESWGWYDLDKIPEPYFGTTSITLEAYKTGRNFLDM
ncbi:MAG: NUDIX domain-containing protein [Patescibacteria group bacterium]